MSSFSSLSLQSTRLFHCLAHGSRHGQDRDESLGGRHTRLPVRGLVSRALHRWGHASIVVVVFSTSPIGVNMKRVAVIGSAGCLWLYFRN